MISLRKNLTYTVYSTFSITARILATMKQNQIPKKKNNNGSVWKNLLASSLLSLLSLFGVCSNRHRKMAGNRGDEKETRVDWQSKLSLYLSWVVYYSLLVPTRFSREIP